MTSWAEAEALTADWDRLAAVASLPASAPGLLLPWFRHIGARSGELHVVEVRDGDGVLIGLLPAWRQVRGRLATLRLLGAGTVHRLGVLAAPGHEREVVEAVAAHVATDADVAAVRLEGVCAHRAEAEGLAAAWPGGRAWQLAEERMTAPVVTLDAAGHDAWLATRSDGLRRTLRKQRARLERSGGSVTHARGAAAHDAIDALVALHRREWEVRQGEALDERTAAVLHEACDALGDRMWLQVLELDGAPRAVELQMAAGDTVQAVVGAYEPIRTLSPGLLTLEAAIRRAHEDGFRHLDLCGGEHAYKTRLADLDVPLAWWTVLPPGLHALRGVTAERGRLGRVLARRVPGARRLRDLANGAGVGAAVTPPSALPV